MMGKEIHITNDIGDHRYEARLDGTLAGFASYTINGDVLEFTHTEVFDQFSGRGVASTLIHAALDDIQERGEYWVKPTCPFVAAYIEKTDEFKGLLA